MVSTFTLNLLKLCAISILLKILSSALAIKPAIRASVVLATAAIINAPAALGALIGAARPTHAAALTDPSSAPGGTAALGAALAREAAVDAYWRVMQAVALYLAVVAAATVGTEIVLGTAV